MDNFSILYEDNHLLVVNKRSGLLVQPDQKADLALEQLAKAYLKEKYQKPGEVFLGIVHRIDRPVSGLVVLARTSKALTRLNESFQERNVQKTYWAVTANIPAPEQASLLHWLKRDKSRNLSVAYLQQVKDSQVAQLSYRLLQTSERYCLLEIDLHTGRHHQIRAQLKAIGCPIVGDLKYGYPRSSPDGSIFLHSRRLSFVHPVNGALMVLEAPVPALWKRYGFAEETDSDNKLTPYEPD
jgi:23S rRNA pseudouridine1911/1915/1917 synthase